MKESEPIQRRFRDDSRRKSDFFRYEPEDPGRPESMQFDKLYNVKDTFYDKLDQNMSIQTYDHSVGVQRADQSISVQRFSKIADNIN